MKKIAVLTTYRTGSTAFCDLLSKQHDLENLDEHFHYMRVGNYPARKNIVVKVMPNQVVQPEFDTLLKESYAVYGLYRKNLVKQVASYFLCISTGTWHIRKDEPKKEYSIDFKDRKQQGLLISSIKYIKKYNDLYVNLFRPVVQKEFFYEDVCSLLKDSDYDVYSKPKNYDELLEQLKKKLDGPL